jgi:glutathione S-transferase
MALARDLLEHGESAAVLQYLEECAAFWSGNRGKLAEWMALIRAGLKPDFGVNVVY